MKNLITLLLALSPMLMQAQDNWEYKRDTVDCYYSLRMDNFLRELSRRKFIEHYANYIGDVRYTEMITKGKTPVTIKYGDLIKVYSGIDSGVHRRYDNDVYSSTQATTIPEDELGQPSEISERVSTYEDGFSFALGFDLANATIGGTVNPPKLDYTIDAFYRANNIELGVAIECFPYLHYRSEGLYIRYVEDLGIKNKWEVAPSIGRGTIIRDFGQFRSWNTQFEVRYKIKRFKIVYCVEYRHRTDLGRFVLSSFGKGSFILFKD